MRKFYPLENYKDVRFFEELYLTRQFEAKFEISAARKMHERRIKDVRSF